MELPLDLLGEAIKQDSKERRLTQEELGQLIGVNKSQISKIENSLTGTLTLWWTDSIEVTVRLKMQNCKYIIGKENVKRKLTKV